MSDPHFHFSCIVRKQATDSFAEWVAHTVYCEPCRILYECRGVKSELIEYLEDQVVRQVSLDSFLKLVRRIAEDFERG